MSVRYPLLTLCVILAGSCQAQYLSEPSAADPWLKAHRQCLGNEINADWMMDLLSEGTEVHISPDGAMVLVDHLPAMAPRSTKWNLKDDYSDLAGTSLMIQGPVSQVSTNVTHALFAGTLNGTEVIMDQYTEEVRGIPVQVTRVIRRPYGVDTARPYDDTQYVLALMEEDDEAVGTMPMLTQAGR